MREAGYEDLHKNIQDFRSLNPGSQLRESIDRAINREYAPKPLPAVEQSPAQAGTAMHEQSGAPAQMPEIGSFAAAASQDMAASGQGSVEHRAAPALGTKAPVHEPSKDHAAPVA